MQLGGPLDLGEVWKRSPAGTYIRTRAPNPQTCTHARRGAQARRRAHTSKSTHARPRTQPHNHTNTPCAGRPLRPPSRSDLTRPPARPAAPPARQHPQQHPQPRRHRRHPAAAAARPAGQRGGDGRRWGQGTDAWPATLRASHFACTSGCSAAPALPQHCPSIAPALPPCCCMPCCGGRGGVFHTRTHTHTCTHTETHTYTHTKCPGGTPRKPPHLLTTPLFFPPLNNSQPTSAAPWPSLDASSGCLRPLPSPPAAASPAAAAGGRGAWRSAASGVLCAWWRCARWRSSWRDITVRAQVVSPESKNTTRLKYTMACGVWSVCVCALCVCVWWGEGVAA